MDGASAWQRFRNITLPQLRPVIVAITSLDFIWNFNSFGLVYVLTRAARAARPMLPMLFAYKEAFRYGNFGYAAALGNVMVIVIVVLLALYLRRRLQGGEAEHARTRPIGRPLQYVALAGYMVFLAFPLLWLLSTRVQVAARAGSTCTRT